MNCVERPQIRILESGGKATHTSIDVGPIELLEESVNPRLRVRSPSTQGSR